MDYTLTRAGRTTHLKIVVVALVAAVVVVTVGINARTDHIAIARGPTDGVVVKAGQPTSYVDQRTSTIR
jgi:hypothetical protein